MASLSAPTCWVLALTLLAMCCTSEAWKGGGFGVSAKPPPPKIISVEAAEALVDAAAAKVASVEKDIAFEKTSIQLGEAKCNAGNPVARASCLDQVYAYAGGTAKTNQYLLESAQDNLRKTQETLRMAYAALSPVERQKRLDIAKANLPVVEKRLADAKAAREVAQKKYESTVAACTTDTSNLKGFELDIAKSKYFFCVDSDLSALRKAEASESDAVKALQKVKDAVKYASG